MAIKLDKNVQDWNVETLRSMVEKLGKIEKGFFSTGEPVQLSGLPVYEYCEILATAGVVVDGDNCRFYFTYYGSYIYTDYGVTSREQEIVSKELYTIEPTLVDESMFLDFMIFIGECSEEFH